MAIVHFFEKPGCVSNARQKQLLIKSGHELIIHDLLKQPWREDLAKLRSFFGELPVADWFNRSAAAIKNHEINPEGVNEQQAIDLMVADPILIRRPLLEANGHRCVGFDIEYIQTWIGLATDVKAVEMENCNKHVDSKVCSP